MKILDEIFGITFNKNIAVKVGGIIKIENKSQGTRIAINEIRNIKLQNTTSRIWILISNFFNEGIPIIKIGTIMAKKNNSKWFNTYKKNNRTTGIVNRVNNCFLFKLGLRVPIIPPKTNRIPIYGIIGIGEKLAHPKPRLKILWGLIRNRLLK